MKTAIITGITGQDGAYLSELLLKEGYKVIGLVRGNTSLDLWRLEYLKIKDKILFEECDLLDMSSIMYILRLYQPIEFYNLAAQSSVASSFRNPISTIHFNTISVLNILESIRLADLNTRFYQASSSEMYGYVPAELLPIDENTPLHPLSPYAISKATAHWTTINYRESYGLYACCGILFNHESYLRTSTFFIKKVLTDALAIKFGEKNILEVGNLMVKRDFGFAKDYVRAMWMILQANKPDDYIICSGKSYMLKDIVEYIFKKLSIPLGKIQIVKHLYRPTDIQDIYGDNTKAKDLLGWEYNKDFFNVLDLLIQEEERNYTK